MTLSDNVNVNVNVPLSCLPPTTTTKQEEGELKKRNRINRF